jgi:glycosyltransferase involved in cell wall biosynthesis
MRTSSPILSICIPTWNRAELLRLFLENLANEIHGLEDRVEVVVADNASTDHTTEVVNQSKITITYGKQPKTVGITNNILFATCDLAHGEFVWLLGDDDLILPGGVERVLDSITRAPDVDYHYINFSWIPVKYRETVLKEMCGNPPEALLRVRQCDVEEWRRLDRIEDLAFLPGYNPSSLFAGIFCYTVKRTFYDAARKTLRPSDSLDGSSTVLEDNFPQAMITLPPMAGRPIAYIGKPCMMQGTQGWEWGAFAYKTLILGNYDLFRWLEKTPFAPDALDKLWESAVKTAGRLYFSMLYYPDLHKGLDLVQKEAIPHCSRFPAFWDSLSESAKLVINTEDDAKLICRLVRMASVQSDTSRIGLWGVAGRGHIIVHGYPDISRRIVWAADSNVLLQSGKLENTDVFISPPATLYDADLDILILGVKEEHVNEVSALAKHSLKRGAMIVSVTGIETI